MGTFPTSRSKSRRSACSKRSVPSPSLTTASLTKFWWNCNVPTRTGELSISPGSSVVCAMHSAARPHTKGITCLTDILAIFKPRYLRRNLFEIKGETYFQHMGIFGTDFDRYTEDAVRIFASPPQT